MSDATTKRGQAVALLLRHTSLSRDSARQILTGVGLRIANQVRKVTDSHVDLLLAAAAQTPPGPHVEACWNSIVAEMHHVAEPPVEAVSVVPDAVALPATDLAAASIPAKKTR